MIVLLKITKRNEERKIARKEGNVTGEFYFDTQGSPTKSLLGEYGQLYERDENGRINQITYLDSDGNAETNSAGYTILKRIYYRDGNINTDMYFDKVGNPVALSKGQYGKFENIAVCDMRGFS